MNKKVVGAIIDGCCRDVSEVRAMNVPVILKGIVPNVASNSGYGHVNVDIQCAGVSVSPRDIINR
ncbi:RraA family protein [Pueribacillus sp. YX66]|uniref:RraA family protein n=1 Tax=Pueribacillus sp. YX66 TaxID=3229242 RepID=UPI00358D7294